MQELAYERRFREWVAGRGMRAERLRYRRDAAGGVTLAYRFTPAGRPRARVLVAHGGGNDALFSFPGLFKELLLRGLEIFTFDLDGHGRASTTHFSPKEIGGSIDAAFEQARAVRPDLPAHALGVSLGGSVLLHALPRLGEAVTSAVFVCAPLRVDFGRRAVARELLNPSLTRAVFRQRSHVGLWGLIPSFGPVKRGVYPLRLARPAAGAFGYVDVFNDALDRMRLEAAARATRVPVLLVYGGRDQLVPPAQGRRLAELIPDAELLIVERGSHLTTVFAAPAMERIFAWLDAGAAEGRGAPTEAIADGRRGGAE